MMFKTAGKQLLPCLFLLIVVCLCRAETVLAVTKELDSEHQRGVNLARKGQHDDGLMVLLALNKKYPDFYPLERDIVMITAWKGDCRAAARRYERIRDYPKPEPSDPDWSNQRSDFVTKSG
jgi:hypothetical protein